MKEGAKIYSEFTLSRINKVLLNDPLTERQVRLIRTALAEQDAANSHAIDLRFSLPLGVKRFYFCFFAGADRRSKTLKHYTTRMAVLSRRTSSGFLFVLLSIASLCLCFAIFFGLYSIKKALGIDVFPEFHLQDLLPWPV